MQIDAPPKPEKTYVTVLASIDQTGLMEPREIIWPDGRKFPIDRVECWRKALDHGPETTYYVIEIGGRKRILYFTQSPICSIVNMGRWYHRTDPAHPTNSPAVPLQ